MRIDPVWGGDVQFYELAYGSWLAYLFLVLMWERVLRAKLPEWKYALILLLGASAFLINHYFQRASFWLIAINVYTLLFLIAYYVICIRAQPRSFGWKALALVGAIVFTFAYIGFENVARYFVTGLGYSEFWFTLTAFLGFAAIIVWRGRAAR